MEWIRTKERLPEPGVLVFGTFGGHSFETVMYYNGEGIFKSIWVGKNMKFYRLRDITHWMPIPDLPEK